jgi:crossover junction endodeoxyribonuclease RuvC
MRDVHGDPNYILALDLALKTGFAFGAVGTPVPEFGSHKLCGDGEQLGVRFRALRTWVAKMLAERPSTTRVIFEAPILRPHDKIGTVRALCGYAAIVEELLEWWPAIRLTEATPSEHRRHFLGNINKLKSKAIKDLTVAKCRRLGWNPTDTDAADALSLWHYQCSLIDPRLAIEASPLFLRRAAS